jgi:hypothetical protein
MTSSMNQLHILVADDDPSVREVLQEILMQKVPPLGSSLFSMIVPGSRMSYLGDVLLSFRVFPDRGLFPLF